MALHIDLKYTNFLACHFEKFVRKGDYLFNMRCPLCGDSQTKKTKARGYIYQSKQRLAYKCHNCHASLWLGALIKSLNPQLYKEYVLETFKDNPTALRKHASPANTVTTSIRFGTVAPIIYRNAEKICDLPKQHYAREYVKSRQIPQEHWSRLYFTEHYLDFLNEIVPDHGKEIKNDDRLVIPFYDSYGAVIAVSGRSFDDIGGRYITVRTTKDANKLIYGMERVNQSELVIVVEGPLDSLFLPNAVASGDANLALAAKQLSAAKVVLAWDNERRSPEICRQMERAIKLGHDVVIWPTHIMEKDINSMVLASRGPSVIMDLLYNNTWHGLSALTRLAHWKKLPTQTRSVIL